MPDSATDKARKAVEEARKVRPLSVAGSGRTEATKVAQAMNRAVKQLADAIELLDKKAK